MQDNGELPNYGANDGALFFPLAEQAYRDYRPQLDALARVLGEPGLTPSGLEEGEWLGIEPSLKSSNVREGTSQFPDGGIYTFRKNRLFAFLKAQSYRDRPTQADNLHLDLWIDGENVLRDQGTYRYNTEPELRRYFVGTAAHNSVMLDGLDQMTKGPRFIWHEWTASAGGEWVSPNEFEGYIVAFRPLGRGVRHERRVEFDAYGKHVQVRDLITGAPEGTNLHQIWHPNPAWFQRLKFSALDGQGRRILPSSKEGAYSSLYGTKDIVTDLIFETRSTILITDITWT